jgi:hypothetical protein
MPRLQSVRVSYLLIPGYKINLDMSHTVFHAFGSLYEKYEAALCKVLLILALCMVTS